MSNQQVLIQIANTTGITGEKITKTVQLLDEGNTVPFIARYRKEMTGELDETQIREIEEKLRFFRNLLLRKQEVLQAIDGQGKLTAELKQQITQASKITMVEDIYRPYRPKRRTRATIAREKGLEPLAKYLLSYPQQGDVLHQAHQYLNAELAVLTVQEAIQGAQDIVAEQISDNADVRGWMRRFMSHRGLLTATAKDDTVPSVYDMYYQYSEPIHKVAPHRVLAINRGEREEFLKVKIVVDNEMILQHLFKSQVKQGSLTSDYVQDAIKDALQRLVLPAMEREVRNQLTAQAEDQAIKVFSQNLRQLLLQPPLVGQVVLGVDPAYRTGCKWAVVDDTGRLHDVGVVYPTHNARKLDEAKQVFSKLAGKYQIDVIAIGNGTASRETESFVAEFIREYSGKELRYAIVNEAGASVYSASELAGQEFPQLDVAERSAVSIARRLQDPLAELVKIEPRSLGVGQYQHDINRKQLDENLTRVVASVVNYVGVDLNTASPALLSYVAGINATVAQNIVSQREEQGRFTNRHQLKKVSRLGPKTYQQCVGFLRINDGQNPLDKTPIHPESYDIVQALLQHAGYSLTDVGSTVLRAELAKLNINDLSSELGAGLPTLKDIIEALARPGRDPREELPKLVLRTDVMELKDIHVGMELRGTVHNVVDFGAFVDIGVEVDGLIHISKLANRYIKHPLEVVAVGDIVTVQVLDVDLTRKRVALQLKG